MTLRWARTSLHDGSSLVVQDTWSTCEHDGSMNMAKRWLHVLAPHGNGWLQLGLVCNDAPVTPWPPSHSCVNLRVFRERVQTSWTDIQGCFPTGDGTEVTVTLRNVDGECLHECKIDADDHLREHVEQAVRELVEIQDYDPDWRSTTPVFCEFHVQDARVFSARIALNCQHRLDDPF
jgi:hypothetical protein